MEQALWSPRWRSIESLTESSCHVDPPGRCSLRSTRADKVRSRRSVSSVIPPVLSKIRGSNPKFCRSQRVFMSECFRFRSAYRSAAARAPAAEARRVALWNGIAQSNASLGKRRQDDWWTSGRLTMSTSAGTGERGGGEEVIGFQDGAGTSSGSKTIHHIPKSGMHLLFMSLAHAPHAMMSLRIQVLLTKRTSQPIVKNFDPQPHRKYVVKCSVGEESILTPGRRCLQPSICQWRRVRRQASPTTEVMLVHQP